MTMSDFLRVLNFEKVENSLGVLIGIIDYPMDSDDIKATCFKDVPDNEYFDILKKAQMKEFITFEDLHVKGKIRGTVRITKAGALYLMDIQESKIGF
jgi:hypothetical protein